MSSITKQTLFLPGLIKIQFIDEEGSPALVSNVLIAIKIYASYRNDITILPFASDQNGIVTIVKTEIESRVDDCISFGLMDYVDVIFAKPTVSINFMGTNSINRQLGVEIDPALLLNLNQFVPGFNEGNYRIEQAEKAKQNKNYSLFASCYNLTTKIEDDLILIKDDWGNLHDELSYRLKLPF